jgi:ABC-type uncharacterized transport system substrate-binding protein
VDRRRFLLTSLAGALAAPLAAGAQTAAKKARVGMLGSNPVDPALYEMFKQGLGELGYTEDHLVLIVREDADTPTRLPALAADLVRARPDVIFVRGPVAVAAAVKASKTIPIVAIDLESDPIALGYARTLAQPGGNVTGVFLDLPELSAKQLQLFREIVPRLSRVALVGDSTGNAVFAHRIRLAALGRETRLATVSLFTEFAEAGGLLTYGPSLRESFRRSGIFVGKVLKGAKPANLPIERPEKFELVINLKTAKALGLTIPPSLLARADQVIE